MLAKAIPTVSSIMCKQNELQTTAASVGLPDTGGKHMEIARLEQCQSHISEYVCSDVRTVLSGVNGRLNPLGVRTHACITAWHFDILDVANVQENKTQFRNLRTT